MCDLPTELISEIFLSYHQSTQAPILLLLVCRHWRDIALSISALWSTIRWSNLLHIKPTVYGLPPCRSPTQAERAVGRAGAAKISIISDLKTFHTYMDANTNLRSWLSTKCRVLSIKLQSEETNDFAIWFHGLANLEELSLTGVNWFNTNTSCCILETVEKESRRLVHLELNNHIPEDLANRHSMLKHLRTLKISNVSLKSNEDSYDRVVGQLINLEELTWPFDTPSTLHCISGNLRSLTIQSCETFSRIPYGQLTSLNLTCAMLSVWGQEVVDLPSLRHLTFLGYWANFMRLRAPLLTDLELQCRDLQVDRGLTSPVWILPRSLTINTISEGNLLKLIEGAWSEVEEIHLVHLPFQPNILGRTLTTALSGTKDRAPLCPSLRHLTMKTADPSGLTKYEEDRVELRLRAIVRERKRYGKGLQSVRRCWDQSLHPSSSRRRGACGAPKSRPKKERKCLEIVIS